MNGATTGSIGVQDQDGTVGTINCGSNANCVWDTTVTTMTVTLTGVTNQQWITLTLHGVSDGIYTNDVAVRAGVLLADVNTSSNIDSADVTLVQRQNNKPVTSSNFRMDVNASGNIDSADVTLTQRQNQKRLP